MEPRISRFRLGFGGSAGFSSRLRSDTGSVPGGTPSIMDWSVIRLLFGLRDFYLHFTNRVGQRHRSVSDFVHRLFVLVKRDCEHGNPSRFLRLIWAVSSPELVFRF